MEGGRIGEGRGGGVYGSMMRVPGGVWKFLGNFWIQWSLYFLRKFPEIVDSVIPLLIRKFLPDHPVIFRKSFLRNFPEFPDTSHPPHQVSIPTHPPPPGTSNPFFSTIRFPSICTKGYFPNKGALIHYHN